MIEAQPIRNVDDKKIEIEKNQVLLFSILRNESLRLPHFLEYYKSLGVDRFFFVDNNSSDSSKEIISRELIIISIYKPIGILQRNSFE